VSVHDQTDAKEASGENSDDRQEDAGVLDDEDARSMADEVFPGVTGEHRIAERSVAAEQESLERYSQPTREFRRPPLLLPRDPDHGGSDDCLGFLAVDPDALSGDPPTSGRQ
jgi:hypothetical protein